MCSAELNRGAIMSGSVDLPLTGVFSPFLDLDSGRLLVSSSESESEMNVCTRLLFGFFSFLVDAACLKQNQYRPINNTIIKPS